MQNIFHPKRIMLGLGVLSICVTVVTSCAENQAANRQVLTHPVAEPSPSPSAAPSVAPPRQSNPVVVSFKKDVTPILKQHCIACHSPGGSVPEHSWWFKADGEPHYDNIKSHVGVMIRMIKEGEMPMGKPNSVPEAQVKTLENWRAGGAKNN